MGDRSGAHVVVGRGGAYVRFTTDVTLLLTMTHAFLTSGRGRRRPVPALGDKASSCGCEQSIAVRRTVHPLARARIALCSRWLLAADVRRAESCLPSRRAQPSRARKVIGDSAAVWHDRRAV